MQTRLTWLHRARKMQLHLSLELTVVASPSQIADAALDVAAETEQARKRAAKRTDEELLADAKADVARYEARIAKRAQFDPIAAAALELAEACKAGDLMLVVNRARDVHRMATALKACPTPIDAGEP